jgi:hypothetical protein
LPREKKVEPQEQGGDAHMFTYITFFKQKFTVSEMLHFLDDVP